jgi:amino acid transporter
MILAAGYIVSLFGLPTGRTFLPFGDLGSPVSVSVLVISMVGLLGMLAVALAGIRLGAGFATVLGVISMVPLTALVFLPLFNPSSMDFSNLSGFPLPPGSTAASPCSWPGSSS